MRFQPGIKNPDVCRSCFYSRCAHIWSERQDAWACPDEPDPPQALEDNTTQDDEED